MNTQLDSLASMLTRAKSAEDVFGTLTGSGVDLLAQVRKSYHVMVRVTHPDLYLGLDEKRLAQTALGQLINWFKLAEQQIHSGSYGQTAITLQSKKRMYRVQEHYQQDGIFNNYPCSFVEAGQMRLGTLKLVRDPHNNALAQNEFNALGILQRSWQASKFAPYLPGLIEAFVYQQAGLARQAGVFERLAGWFSLEDVRKAYPDGIDPRDMAWIWRRLLSVLGFAHRAGLIHAAVLPANILILPDQHGLMLINWCFSGQDSTLPWEYGSQIDPAYRAWYPDEVVHTGRLSTRADLVMSASCMLFLLGSQPPNTALPESLPASLKAFFRGCLLPGKKAPQDAWALKQDFDECIARLWGERKFHPFKM
jgi:hypothetical protein